MSDSPLKLHIFAPDWTKLSLQKVSEFIKDGTHGTHMRVSSGIPLLSAKNISPFGEILITDDDSLISAHEYEKIHSKYELEKNDLLLTVVGTLGRRALVTGSKKFAIQRSVGVIRCKKKIILPEFIYQFTGTDYFQDQLILRSNATAQAGVYLGELAKIEAPCPPLPEQQKIAAILSSVDDVIEKKRAQIGKLKDLKTGMMQELMTAGIGHTEFKPLPKWRVGRIAELDRIPANWELVDLVSVAKLESGHTPSRDNEEYWGGDIQWLSLHDTKNLVNPILKLTAYSVTPKGIDNSSARILPKDTVALSRTASVGNCVMLGRDMATSQDFANYVCSDRLHPKYLLQLFRWMQHVWSNLSEGSTHKTIYMPVFKKLQVLLPPYAEQIKIAAAADKIDADIAAKDHKLAMVLNLKKALMQDLLTGKVRVKIDQKEPAVA